MQTTTQQFDLILAEQNTEKLKAFINELIEDKLLEFIEFPHLHTDPWELHLNFGQQTITINFYADESPMSTYPDYILITICSTLLNLRCNDPAQARWLGGIIYRNLKFLKGEPHHRETMLYYKTMARFYLENKMPEKAFNYFRKLTKYESQIGLGCNHSSCLLIELASNASCLDLFEYAQIVSMWILNIIPDRNDLYGWDREVYLFVEKTLAQCIELIETEEKNTSLQYIRAHKLYAWRGIYWKQTRRYTLAQKDFEKSLQYGEVARENHSKETLFTLVYCNLANVFFELNQFEQAENCYLRALQTEEPNNNWQKLYANSKLADLYIQTKDDEKGKESLANFIEKLLSEEISKSESIYNCILIKALYEYNTEFMQRNSWQDTPLKGLNELCTKIGELLKDRLSQLPSRFLWLLEEDMYDDEKEENEEYTIDETYEYAESGDAEAQVGLALCYYQGREIKQNKLLAFAWLTKASLQGNEDAQQALEEFTEIEGTEIALYYHHKRIHIYKEEFGTHPEMAVAYNAIGEIYINKEDTTQAVEAFRKAIENDKENITAHYYLGVLLSDIGTKTSDYPKLVESCEKLQIVAQLIEEAPTELYTYWGCSLLNASKLTDSLLENKDQIEALFTKEAELDYAYGTYDLTCLYSLLNNKEKALYYLEEYLKTNDNEREIPTEAINCDTDFDNIRNENRFKELLKDYLQESRKP